MLGRFCFTLLFLLCSSSFKVSALDTEEAPSDLEEQARLFNQASGHIKVQYEVARAAFLPTDATTSRGNTELHCEGDRKISDMIYWAKNGAMVNSQRVDDQYEANVQNIYTVVDENEAYYSCNGVGLYLLKEQPKKPYQETSVWQGSTIVCIDKVASEENKARERIDGLYKTSIFMFAKRQIAMYPVKERKVTANMTITCNNTDSFKFISETKPTTKVEFKGKKIICTCTDNLGRCELKIFFGDKLVASGPSPVLEHTYKHILIQKVSCTADCTIGGDFTTLAVQDIEINRSLYIGVVFVIILIIIIIIIIILCVLWHKFGFKEKYGYQINMKLKRNFEVDTNKLSRYHMAGVDVDGDVAVDDDSEPDVMTKEFRDMDDGSLVEDDSFVDPNFARTNQKIDMRSKDDISGQHPAQRPFLRI